MSPRTTQHADVAIAGAGPTGLLLAAELAMRGVHVVVLERNVERPPFVRAFNLGPRSLEILDRRGIAERFLAEGRRVPFMHFAALDDPLDLSGLETDHPYVLGIAQTRTEALLEAHALEQGAELRWGHEVRSLEQDDGIRIDVARTAASGDFVLHARWLVGCDGGRSTVRKLAGIPFPGTAATRWALLGDVELADPASLAFGSHETGRGTVFVIPRPGYVRVIVNDPSPRTERDRHVTLDELTGAVHGVLGRDDVAFHKARWLTRFGNAARIAERYRDGRVFVAGDAAHVHPPAGAQGLNVGLQDAFNLGWKLAAAVRGDASPATLDSYHAERHPAGERVLMHTRAQAELGQRDERMAPVRGLLKSIARNDAVRRELAELVTGLGTRYDVADADAMARQPWLGRLAPNAPVSTMGSATTIAGCLHDGRAVLLVRDESIDVATHAAGLEDRLSVAHLARGQREPSWLMDLDAALIRPDGHIAWMATANSDVTALPNVLARWLGRGQSADSTT
jgi:2-polyprenyl-6-methoxyphenol hydroxylase-like FAD-dependent oxidoreductase